MKQFYVKKEIIIILKKRVALHKRIYQKIVWGQIQGGKKDEQQKENFTFGSVKSFLFPYSISIV